MIVHRDIEFWGLRGFPEYYISTCGQVLSTKYGKKRILKLRIDSNGYPHVVLCKDGKQEPKKIHRLVAMAFLPDFNNPELVVDHKDHDKANNNLKNLRMVPLSDNNRNQKDAVGVYEWFSEKYGIPYYIAQWYDDTGTQRKKYFNLNKYGADEAYRLATELRKEMVDQYYNRPEPSDS
jgi:hypothetical protein